MFSILAMYRQIAKFPPAQTVSDSFSCYVGNNIFISLWAWARRAKILALVCGQIGTYRFLMLFLVLILLNPQLCKYVDSTEITSVR